MKYLLLILIAVIASTVHGAITDVTGDQTWESGGNNWGTVRVDYGLPQANSQITITKYIINQYQTYGTSHTIANGQVGFNYLETYEQSTIDILRSNAFSISCNGGTMNIYDMQHSTMDVLFVYASITEQGTMNIYGTDCQWSFVGSSADLTGYWFNGESFRFQFRDSQASTLENVHIIPEPTTLLLIGLGGLMLRRKR